MAIYSGRIQAEVFGECRTCGKRELLGTGDVVKLSWVACKALLIKRGWKLLNFCKFQCPDCQKAEETRRATLVTPSTSVRRALPAWTLPRAPQFIEPNETPAVGPRPFTNHAMPEEYRRARMAELRSPAYAEDDEGVSDG